MFPYQTKGRVKRTPAEQVALAVRILDEMHFDDVYARAVAELGDRINVVGPLDLTRNTLRTYTDRVGTAYLVPPLVDDLSEYLAALLGDSSASTTVESYATAGGRPMPTVQVQASAEVLRYRLGAGYAGVLLDWSERFRRISLRVIPPDDLEVEYSSGDPLDPTVIRHSGTREVDGRGVAVVEVYDLTDLDRPSYRVMDGDKDITQKIHGRTFEGADYWWRDSEGRPFHRLVISGTTRRPYAKNGLIETTLRVCVLWTHWGAGVRDAGHPQRNVRGLGLVGADSDMDTSEIGQAVGAETVVQWYDLDPERPGTHWQDGPGFNPEVIARSIRTYELTALSALGLPVDYEQTGGEPTAQERTALLEVIASTFAECRRFDSEVLARAGAMANRLIEDGSLDEAPDVDETPYGVLYRDEVITAISAPVTPENKELAAIEDHSADESIDGDTVVALDVPASGKASDIALNGAQVQAAQGIVESVAIGDLPRDTGVAMLSAFFNLPPAQAETIMGTVGRGFSPTQATPETTE